MAALRLILLTGVMCLASNPGVRVGIKTEAISTFKDKVIPIVMNNIGDIKISD